MMTTSLAQRCNELGVALVCIDGSGTIREVQCPSDSWLAKVIIDSKLFQSALHRSVPSWHDTLSHEALALWPGCWALPMPIHHRRRVIGYQLALIFSVDLLRSEQFNRIIDAARLDVPASAAIASREGLINPNQVQTIATMLQWMANDLSRLDQRDGEVGELSRQLGETYEELSLVYDLSARMTVNETPGTFLGEAVAELQQVVGLRWFVLHVSHHEFRLNDLAGQVLVAGDPPLGRDEMDQVARHAMAQLNAADEAKIVTDVASFGLPQLADHVARILVVPLAAEGKVVGLILGAEKADGSGLSSIDSKLVNSLAQSISIFLENSMLYDDLQDMFMGTLRALVSAIDAKDAYTCGHSERVAWLGRELGKAAGLDDQMVERLYLSGLLHDVGKIGIPESVLTKPGKLTKEEFDIIKTHPRLGGKIIHGVRQMQDLVPGVLYHHERYDGRGYPEGLSGEDIPLFGRLLCLADSFDAMSSTRTYRKALPLDKVLQEVHDCAGSQFDPDLAEVFVKLDFEPYRQMVHEHQKRESLLRREMEGSK
jgi:HD-GYP domain-containing protein (c-di-GMP phosphodiesterase class II)